MADYNYNQIWNEGRAYFIEPNDPYPVQPKAIKLPLMEHQRYAVQYCLQMESPDAFTAPGTDYIVYSNKALFCDPVGAGKSLVMLSLISEAPIVRNKSFLGTYCAAPICVIQKQEEKEVTPFSVIVVPNTLFTQWKEYIVTQTILPFGFIKSKKDIDGFKYEGLTGVLINSTFYNETITKKVLPERVSRVIFDEVHMMSIASSERIDASFCWFISASPCEIDRFTTRKRGFIADGLRELLMTARKCGLIFRNKQSIIDLSITLPKPHVHVMKVKTSNILNVLSGIVSNSILESIAAGDIQQAMGALSLEVTDEDNIIAVVNSHLQKELDSYEVELQAKMIRHYSSQRAKEEALKLVEDKILEVKKKIQDVKDRIFQDNIDPISYEEIQNPVITKCCQNKFDFASLTNWLLKVKTACPLCRKAMNPKDLVALGTKSVPMINLTSEVFNDKEEALEAIFSNMRTKSKIIISSGPTGNFFKIMELANKFKMTVRQLNGNIQTKNKILEDFKTGSLNILYLPAYESGSGLNLTEATDLVLYHKMSNGIEDQVIGRAQRLGRTTPLNIWKIQYENEQ